MNLYLPDILFVHCWVGEGEQNKTKGKQYARSKNENVFKKSIRQGKKQHQGKKSSHLKLVQDLQICRGPNVNHITFNVVITITIINKDKLTWAAYSKIMKSKLDVAPVCIIYRIYYPMSFSILHKLQTTKNVHFGVC